ncbi:hypothetical protein [Polaribacter sp. Q13]|uniref:hypothetical protein n=1 Tax=Polaribacter sp. Q13 TaxID=2806551 RepID=UPI00193B8A9D|nr:hypothetical protein [Polaribacter sp. Q13]QVY66900.1 hypothetical protein JOP69_06350 [Polaribacter sp. Q13]
MKKTKLILVTTFLLLTTVLFSQDINRLVENNGFKKIKLNSNIYDYVTDGYYDFVKNTPKNNPDYHIREVFDYVYATGDLKKIVDITISSIYVKTINDTIYEIKVYMPSNTEIYDMLNMAFGKPTREITNRYASDYGIGSGDAYYWEPKNSSISLNFFFGEGIYCSITYTNETLKESGVLQKKKEQKKKAQNGF